MGGGQRCSQTFYQKKVWTCFKGASSKVVFIKKFVLGSLKSFCVLKLSTFCMLLNNTYLSFQNKRYSTIFIYDDLGIVTKQRIANIMPGLSCSSSVLGTTSLTMQTTGSWCLSSLTSPVRLTSASPPWALGRGGQFLSPITSSVKTLGG